MKKQMMMALVSLMTLSAQAQANFEVSVSNPSKSAKTDAPVVIDLSKLGSIGAIQRAVVKVDGKEIPSQLDDTNRDCTTMNSASWLTSARRRPRPIRCSSIRMASRHSIRPVLLPNFACLARTRSWQRTSRTSIFAASLSTRRPRMCITTCILMASASRVNWLPCVSISTIARPSTSMAR